MLRGTYILGWVFLLGLSLVQTPALASSDHSSFSDDGEESNENPQDTSSVDQGKTEEQKIKDLISENFKDLLAGLQGKEKETMQKALEELLKENGDLSSLTDEELESAITALRDQLGKTNDPELKAKLKAAIDKGAKKVADNKAAKADADKTAKKNVETFNKIASGYAEAAAKEIGAQISKPTDALGAAVGLTASTMGATGAIGQVAASTVASQMSETAETPTYKSGGLTAVVEETSKSIGNYFGNLFGAMAQNAPKQNSGPELNAPTNGSGGGSSVVGSGASSGGSASLGGGAASSAGASSGAAVGDTSAPGSTSDLSTVVASVSQESSFAKPVAYGESSGSSSKLSKEQETLASDEAFNETLKQLTESVVPDNSPVSQTSAVQNVEPVLTQNSPSSAKAPATASAEAAVKPADAKVGDASKAPVIIIASSTSASGEPAKASSPTSESKPTATVEKPVERVRVESKNYKEETPVKGTATVSSPVSMPSTFESNSYSAPELPETKEAPTSSRGLASIDTSAVQASKSSQVENLIQSAARELASPAPVSLPAPVKSSLVGLSNPNTVGTSTTIALQDALKAARTSLSSGYQASNLGVLGSNHLKELQKSSNALDLARGLKRTPLKPIGVTPKAIPTAPVSGKSTDLSLFNGKH